VDVRRNVPLTDSDEVLMAQVREGDRAAYEALYHRWKEPVFAFLLRRTGARSAAEDAHQEAWLRLYRWRRRYDPTRPFRPWLYAIATNAGRDAYRPEPGLFLLPPAVAAPADPLETRDALVAALHALPPRDRRLLLLEAEGFTPAEIAGILALNSGAVRTGLHRAHARTAAALAALGSPGGPP
jgi:RNA polymerase sigma factor (sigma-70 family)